VRLLFDFLAVAGGTATAFVLLWYLYGEWQPLWAVGCGVISGVLLRRMARPTYRTFPAYLRRPVDTGVVLFGAITTSWATLAREAPSVWLLLWREAITLPVLAIFLGLGLVGVVYSHTRLRAEIEEARAREAALREDTLRARLRALQAQINPHFLFNAFNALAELTHSAPEVAEEMVGDLAHLLRYTLKSSAQGLVPVAQELETLRRYLRVEQARLGDRLHVEQAVAPEALQQSIPGLILQPLVENAVLHGVAPQPGGGTVRIAIEVADGSLLIRVDDDGPGLPDSVRDRLDSDYERALSRGTAGTGQSTGGTGGAGGGIVNVHQRLLLRYRGAASLAVSDLEPGTRVELRIPA
jgi:signal transduction histidine kinase